MQFIVVSFDLISFFKTGGRLAGSCTAALFLKAFVDGIEPKGGEDQPGVQWAHLDIAGAMDVRRKFGIHAWFWPKC